MSRFERHQREYQATRGESLRKKKRFGVRARDEVYRNIEGRDLQVRIYEPQGQGPWPALIQIHGGGWIGGSRLDLQPYAEALASMGFLVFSPDYRVAPQDLFPAAHQDIDALMEWVTEHAQRLGVQAAEGLLFFGFSAGAHLALSAAVMSKAKVGTLPVRSAFLLAVRGDLTAPDPQPGAPDYAPIYLGVSREQNPELYRKASPLYQLGTDDRRIPPVMLASYARDPVIHFGESCKLWAELKRRGQDARVIFEPFKRLHGPDLGDRGVFLQAMGYFFGR